MFQTLWALWAAYLPEVLILIPVGYVIAGTWYAVRYRSAWNLLLWPIYLCPSD